MWLIFGLGNPGEEYLDTKHNTGFLVLDQLASNWQLSWKKKFSSLYAYSREKSVYLVKPLTYMNLSGRAVKKWVNNLEIPLNHLLVVVDDLDLPLGKVRLRWRGSSGGHHGLESIIGELKSKNFPRLKIGVGRPEKRGREADYLLSPFKKSERKQLAKAIEESLLLIENLVDANNRGQD